MKTLKAPVQFLQQLGEHFVPKTEQERKERAIYAAVMMVIVAGLYALYLYLT